VWHRFNPQNHKFTLFPLKSVICTFPAGKMQISKKRPLSTASPKTCIPRQANMASEPSRQVLQICVFPAGKVQITDFNGNLRFPGRESANSSSNGNLRFLTGNLRVSGFLISNKNSHFEQAIRDMS